MKAQAKNIGAGLTRTAIATAAAALGLVSTQVSADTAVPPVSVGVGVQTGFYTCNNACIYSPGTVATGDSSVSGFAVDSVRLYVNGGVTDQIKLTFNTEYTGSGSGPGDNKVEVMDAIGRFEFSNVLNIWVGRFLPPSDRANLYGPYYANDWAPYADGVADHYPDIAVGRDNGMAYWGDFGIVKVQAGVFDGETLNSAVDDKSKLLYAGRVTLDFWDKETGYYFNGTYYGDKDLLALGVAAQSQDSKSTYSIDGLMEKKLGTAGAVTVEAEYEHDNGLTSLPTNDGWYLLGSYLFPQVIGIGKFQVLGKYSDLTVDSTTTATVFTPSYHLKTTEVNLNYIIKAFNARVGIYYLNQKNDSSSASTPSEAGLKMQFQM